MGMLRKVRVFCSLDTKTMLLLVEAYLYLGWARILIYIPFSKISPSLGARMLETPDTEMPENRAKLRSVRQAIQLMSKHTFWESKCLVRAIAGMKMLERRKVESTLYLGTAKDESGKLIAHAWLRSGSFFITGSEGMEKFTVVGKFAKQIVVEN